MSALPPTWTHAKLGDLITGFETGRNFRASGSPAGDGEIGVLKISAVTWGEFRPQENKALLPGDKPLEHETVRSGDLLISRANTTELVGAPVLVETNYPNLMLPDKILRVLYDPRVVDPRYLLHALRSRKARSHLEAQATGTSDSMRNLSQPKLRETPIALAPLPEQRRIADRLADLLARIDSCRRRLDVIPTLLKRFRQAVIEAATTGALTEDWRESTGDSFAWRNVALADAIVEMRNGLAPKPKEEPPGAKILRIGAVRPRQLNLEDHRFLELDAETAQRYSIRQDDLLFTRYNGSLEFVGICARVPAMSEPVVYPDKLIRVRCNAEVALPAYIEITFSSHAVRRQVESCVKSSAGQKGISGADLKSVEFRLPSLQEQAAIASRVEALFAFADAIEKSVNSARSQIQHLPPALLERAFSGELVSQDAADEHAAEALNKARETTAGDDHGRTRRGVFDRNGVQNREATIMLTRKEVARTYLTSILKERGALTAEALWAASQLEIDDFYEQLKDEEANGHLRENRTGQPNEPRLFGSAT